METLNYNKDYWAQPCPKVDCRKNSCKCGLKFVEIPTALGDDTTGKVLPKNGEYCNAIVKYDANNAIYIYSAEGVPVKIKEGVNASQE